MAYEKQSPDKKHNLRKDRSGAGHRWPRRWGATRWRASFRLRAVQVSGGPGGVREVRPVASIWRGRAR
eukprot:2857767-Alexandrium_andersonii.AAC.1